ncbi:MAG: diacylglycerol kinase [Actinobacteria bacterium]|nr:diacylglycerol kinase [Actinomycetota bacterium]
MTESEPLVEYDDVTWMQRLAAFVALLAAGVAVLLVLVFFISEVGWLLIALVGIGLTAGGAWLAVTERMPRRGWGVLLGLIGLAVVVAAFVGVARDDGFGLAYFLPIVAAGALAAGATRVALAHELHQSDAARKWRPRKPVLIANRASGGGKVDEFDIVGKAGERGVEVVLLEPGLDLEQLARDAVAAGADCLGMAGGDGSQALVASVAVELGVPFVCISAGTRNHFAQDLGLDKEDPVAGLAAFTEGSLRRVDFGTVNGRLFVNNVSLGVYATVVQEDSYRDAKVETAATLLPDLLGATAEPFDLEFTTLDGSVVDGAFLILVSNNPYVSGLALDSFQRRVMDSGSLGVIAVDSATGAEAAALATRAALGLAAKDPHLHEFECREFEVRSHGGTADVGIDGEAIQMATPLRFRSHPRGLLMLVPPGNLVASEKRRHRGFNPKDLLAVAAGRIPPSLVKSPTTAPVGSQELTG